MSRSAFLKLDRATERITEFNELLDQKRPFRLVLQTDTKTGKRSILPKQDEAVVDRAALIAGDAVHNIRSALDHAYGDIVSPFATTPREKKAIQFPFSETAARLHEAVKNRLAHRVSQKFFDSIVRLAPHPEPGGNHMLCLIDQLDIPDKHRRLIPMEDYSQLSSDVIIRQVPDFPIGLGGQGFSQCTFSWFVDRIEEDTLGNLLPPFMDFFEKKLNVPVQIVFRSGLLHISQPAVPTLYQLVDVAKQTIDIMRRAAI